MDNAEFEVFVNIAKALERMADTNERIVALWEKQDVRNEARQVIDQKTHERNEEFVDLHKRQYESSIRMNNVLAEKEQQMIDLWKPKDKKESTEPRP